MSAPVDGALGPRAKKALSQHFLIDPNLQKKIVEGIEPEGSDRVLEIGPGTGALTSHLIGRVGHLTLIELDDDLAARLRELHAGRDDVEVVHGNALKLSIAELGGSEPYKVIGNIPYAITTPLVFHILAARPRPRVIVLMVQKEVADRMAAAPGNKDYGALTVGVQLVAQVEPLFKVSRHVFRPRPAVDSVVIRLTPLAPPPLSADEEEEVRDLTRAAFSRRRKQLQKVLRQAPEYGLSNEEAGKLLRSLGIEPAKRPDALAVGDYVRLATALRERN